MARRNKTRGKTVSRTLFDNAKEFFEQYGINLPGSRGF